MDNRGSVVWQAADCRSAHINQTHTQSYRTWPHFIANNSSYYQKAATKGVKVLALCTSSRICMAFQLKPQPWHQDFSLSSTLWKVCNFAQPCSHFSPISYLQNENCYLLSHTHHKAGMNVLKFDLGSTRNGTGVQTKPIGQHYTVSCSLELLMYTVRHNHF